MRHYRETDWLDIPTDPSDTREEEPEHDPDCPTAEEFAATPEKFAWVVPFKDKFQVRGYDTEAAIGEEIVTLAETATRPEAEQFRTNYIASLQKPEYHPIGIAAVLDDIMRRFK
jgi:hypothetical protein